MDGRAIDFLVKPICDERFARAVRRITKAGEFADESPDPSVHSVLVNDGSRERVVELRDLIAIVAIGGNYTEIDCTSGESVAARRPIKDWVRSLPAESFMRTHRSTIANLAHVKHIERREPTRVSLQMRETTMDLPVSRRLASVLRKALHERLFVAA